MKKELRDKIYSMSNSFLPLDMFFNDIEDIKDANYNKEQAYKDLEIVADFILDLQQQIEEITDDTNVWYLLYCEQNAEKSSNEINSDFNKRKEKYVVEMKEIQKEIEKNPPKGFCFW